MKICCKYPASLPFCTIELLTVVEEKRGSEPLRVRSSMAKFRRSIQDLSHLEFGRTPSIPKGTDIPAYDISEASIPNSFQHNGVSSISTNALEVLVHTQANRTFNVKLDRSLLIGQLS
ncbi:uncharacterized protein PHALS_03695 [Plasmopara halstedii]|uniref:Uncharacterized protein n=1 Tax=Plasmopara halstedii TaxID=4781 RepID=A0A0P1AYV3_PLAHL|nr:uncharacterized protein PHALS_03695 [Plasmopara halstedii]CEG47031.1 hypothetical protein PHALS_03695 [Plasmopara halstedii]|eukprot:XP_024583400.1 hypothetical protein PHALS_03695 [Plasmopara halstedii]